MTLALALDLNPNPISPPYLPYISRFQTIAAKPSFIRDELDGEHPRPEPYP